MYLPIPFPPRIARGAVGGHGHFDTTINVGTAGYEAAIANWQRARGRWNVSQGVKTDAQHAEARAHFYQARGRLHHFRFHDWADDEVVLGEGVLVIVPGVGYQAYKAYGTDPTWRYLRKITRIVPGTWQVSSSGGVPSPSTIDNETGITDVGGGELTFTCRFDVPVRYDTDAFEARLKARKPNGTRFLEWADIDLVEVRE